MRPPARALRTARSTTDQSDSRPNRLEVVITSKKGEDTLLRLALGVERRQGARPRERIACIEAFIEHLPIAEGAYCQVGGQPEQAHPVVGGTVVRREILPDVRRKRPLKIGLAWRDHEARRPKKMKDRD